MKVFSLAMVCLAILAPPCHAETTPVPTWDGDVQPIVAKYCAPCHQTGGTASIRLMTYEQARPLAPSIMGRVWTRAMPPANTGQRLTDREVRTVIAWVTGGAPRSRSSK